MRETPGHDNRGLTSPPHPIGQPHPGSPNSASRPASRLHALPARPACTPRLHALPRHPLFEGSQAPPVPASPPPCASRRPMRFASTMATVGAKVAGATATAAGSPAGPENRKVATSAPLEPPLTSPAAQPTAFDPAHPGVRSPKHGRLLDRAVWRTRQALRHPARDSGTTCPDRRHPTTPPKRDDVQMEWWRPLKDSNPQPAD